MAERPFVCRSCFVAGFILPSAKYNFDSNRNIFSIVYLILESEHLRKVAKDNNVNFDFSGSLGLVAQNMILTKNCTGTSISLRGIIKSSLRTDDDITQSMVIQNHSFCSYTLVPRWMGANAGAGSLVSSEYATLNSFDLVASNDPWSARSIFRVNYNLLGSNQAKF
jgi:hypothetical protein